jgi:hypothetical protein
MRVAVIVLGLVVAGAPAAARADCEAPFEVGAAPVELHLRMSRAVWDDLRFAELEGEGCEAQYPYREVEFRCGEEEPWIAIAVRHKRGDQRGLDTDQKPPLKLDFNRVVAGQRWPAALGELGFRRLSLNNGQPDNPGGVLSALLTEYVAWQVMHAEVPTAGRAAHARLTVHFTDDDAVEYHGLYILIEDVDRTAVRSRYGADEGALYKTTTGSCRDEVVFDDGAPNAAAEAVAAWSALDPGDFAGSWAERTEEAIDLEELLRHEALRDVLGNAADTVLGQNYSNYYAFDQRSGRRHYLPWDLDDAFRPYPQSAPADAPLEPSCSPIGALTRCVPEVRQRYLEIACQLANGTLAEERLLATFDSLDAALRPVAMEEDELVWPDDDPFDPEVEGTWAWQLEDLDTWIPARIQFVRAAITAEGMDCPDGCPEGASEPCQYLRCAGERRCQDGRWTTCLVDGELEEPDNFLDDDCDGAVDEGGAGGEADAGTGDEEPTGDGTGSCGCRTGRSQGGAMLFLVALWWWRRGRRRRVATIPPPRPTGSNFW